MKVTKSILPLFFLVLIGSFAISCSNANIPDESTVDCEIASGQGELLFNFGSSGAARSAYALDEIQPKVSSYKLVIYNLSKKYDESFSLTADKKLTLEEGTYNAVIFAVNNTEVYGSGYSKDIVIESGKSTTVTFTLRPFDMSLTCPENVECGKDFDVNYKFDTRNELVVFANAELSINNIVGSKKSISGGMSGITNRTCIEGKCSFTASATPLESVIYLKDPNTLSLEIYDESYNYSLGVSTGSYFIKPYGVVYQYYQSQQPIASLKNLTWCPVNFIVPENATGLNVNIEWEQ